MGAKLTAEAIKLACFAQSGITVSGESFPGINLRNADLTGLHANDLRLMGAKLDGVVLSQAVLRSCQLDGASSKNSQLMHVLLEDSICEGADFTDSNLQGARLSETIFSRAIFQHANLDESKGDGIVFRGADLRGATLRRAKFFGADFRGADLTGADFTGAELKAADFRGAILDDVIWDGASCPNARFDQSAQALGPNPTNKQNPEGVEKTAAVAVGVVENLIRTAVADPGLRDLVEQLAVAQTTQSSDVTPANAHLLLDAIRHELKACGADVSEVLRPFDQVLSLLDSAKGDEPPEELKDWLADIMRSPPSAIADIVAKLDLPPHRVEGAGGQKGRKR